MIWTSYSLCVSRCLMFFFAMLNGVKRCFCCIKMSHVLFGSLMCLSCSDFRSKELLGPRCKSLVHFVMNHKLPVSQSEHFKRLDRRKLHPNESPTQEVHCDSQEKCYINKSSHFLSMQSRAYLKLKKNLTKRILIHLLQLQMLLLTAM